MKQRYYPVAAGYFLRLSFRFYYGFFALILRSPAPAVVPFFARLVVVFGTLVRFFSSINRFFGQKQHLKRREWSPPELFDEVIAIFSLLFPNPYGTLAK